MTAASQRDRWKQRLLSPKNYWLDPAGLLFASDRPAAVCPPADSEAAALFAAAKRGYLDIVKELLDHGVAAIESRPVERCPLILQRVWV